MIKDHSTRNGMSFGSKNVGKYFVLSLIFIVFITACSNGEISPATVGEIEAPSNGFPSSARMMGDLPKSVQPPSEPSQLNGVAAMQMAPVSEDAAAAQGAAGLPQDAQLAAREQSQVQPGGVGSQPQVNEVQPAVDVDLSLPVGPQVGLRAPDFAMQTLVGDQMGLSDFLGYPLVISYWASWCVPCKNELGILTRIFPEYEGRGLKIVTVNAIEQDSIDKIDAFVAEVGLKFPILLDEGDKFSQMYQAVFFPTTIYVDASGVIRYIALGDTSEPEFRSKIEQLLNGEL